MTTFNTLLARAQSAISDKGGAVWETAVVTEWVRDAIRDYSQHFKRTVTVAFELSGQTGQHTFDLPADFISMIQVEYPTGEDPPTYLLRLNRRNPRFWTAAGFYDVEITNDAATTDSVPDNPATFWISDEVVDGETMTWTYTANHDPTVTTTYHITVPAEHEPLLIAYVVWQALLERLAKEAQSPETSIGLFDQYATAAELAEAEYRRALAAAQGEKSASGWTGPWQMDVHDPIY
jgi:hypothetical protein